MQIGFNLTILTAVAIVFAVSSVNAKPVSTNSVADNQSKPDKPGARQSSDISFPVSHIDAVETSTTVVIVNNTLTMSPSNTTTVSYPANIAAETSTSNNNTSATTISEGTAKDTTTFQTSIEETTMVQTTTMASLETVTENQTSTNQTTESGLLTTRYVIHPNIHTATTCPSGYTNDANGGCTKVFP
ncbi:uncharacterized protein LOC113549371 [Rhopalosiphum maidis]|uniref:uncharacterized protein LOC113549371 n=1 Tax=Rhopalosiphum maidis TaxID=43146 RepID=UPI000EFFB938|nr:uncharacterized protein LOC113549371 [Rhopalosiphum maidis]